MYFEALRSEERRLSSEEDIQRFVGGRFVRAPKGKATAQAKAVAAPAAAPAVPPVAPSGLIAAPGPVAAAVVAAAPGAITVACRAAEEKKRKAEYYRNNWCVWQKSQERQVKHVVQSAVEEPEEEGPLYLMDRCPQAGAARAVGHSASRMKFPAMMARTPEKLYALLDEILPKLVYGQEWVPIHPHTQRSTQVEARGDDTGAMTQDE